MWAGQQWLAHFSFVERRASDKAVAVKLVDRTGGQCRPQWATALHWPKLTALSGERPIVPQRRSQLE